jgi:hypothetical protein
MGAPGEQMLRILDFGPLIALHGISIANSALRVNENIPVPHFSEAQSNAVKRKLRSLQWKPETVMRETTLIQRLREAAATESEES